MQTYDSLKALVANAPMPSFWVDLDALDRNLDRVVASALNAKKKIRLATKSVRVPYLIRYLRDRSHGVISGLMCYSAAEVCLLAECGEDNLMMAYPVVTEAELKPIAEWIKKGKSICLLVDESAHIDLIELAFPPDVKAKICIDIDVSYRPLGGLHFGVRRSPLTDLVRFQTLLRRVQNSSSVTLAGVMGYEAQIAGLCDASPFKRAMSWVAKILKTVSRPQVEKRRFEVAQEIRRQGLSLEFFNGGGTGSLQASLEDPSVTEVAVGSGFLQSHLFDYYGANRNEPASFFSLRVTRIPDVGFITCHGGGFIASGSPGWEKCPVVYLPQGLKPLPDEGFGEVQTPFAVPKGVSLAVGDPVFFRSAKAGEIAEQFTHYFLFRGDKLVEKVPTYRGLGL